MFQDIFGMGSSKKGRGRSNQSEFAEDINIKVDL